MNKSIAGCLIAASLVIGPASFAQTGGGAGGAGGAGGVGTAAGGNAAAGSAPGLGGSGAPAATAPATGGTGAAAPSASPSQVPSTVGVAPNSTSPSTYAPANGGGGGGRTTGIASERQTEVVDENEREVSKRIKNICKGC